MRLNLLELFALLELLLRVDLGTVKTHWVEFPRQKPMIGVCRTRLDGSLGPNQLQNLHVLRHWEYQKHVN